MPTVVFMDTDGNVLERIKKMTDVDDMLKIVKQAADHTALASPTPCKR